MNRGREVTVGSVLLGALVLLALAVYFFFGWGAQAGRYPVHVIFSEAPVQRGDYVRLSGVKVGEVQDVALTPDNQAKVTVLLDRGRTIRRNYTIEISSGILVGSNQIDITPVEPGGPIVKPGETLYGTRSPQLADLMSETQKAIAQLRAAAQSATQLLNNKQLLGALEEALNQVASVGTEVAGIGSAARGAIEQMLPSLRQAAANVADATAHASGVLEAAEDTLADPALRASLEQASTNLAGATEHLNETIAAIQRIVEAPEFGENVQATTKNAADALASIKQAADSIKTASDAVKGAAEQAGKVAEKVSRLGVTAPKASGSLSVERVSGKDTTWIEANADLDIGNRLLRIGVADISGDPRVNLQLGKQADRGRLRIGLVQSELGVSYDLALGRSTTLSADLFDPNELRMNVLGYRSLAPGYEAVLGMRDLGQENSLTIGLRATR